MRFSVVSSVIGALLLSACLAPSADGVDPPHVGDTSAHGMPELPRLPSDLLGKLPHGAVARAMTPSNPNEPGSIARVSGDRRIKQRVLLLGATGTEPAYLAAKAALDRIGVPYRPLIATSETLTASLLSDGVSTCNFNGVIVATSSLGYSDPVAGWVSALDTSEWQALADFEAACSARELVWYGWPSSDFGLTSVSGFDSNTAVDAHLTATGKAQFVRVKDAAVIPYRHAAGYRATIADPSTTTSLVEDANGSVLVAKHKGADGREVMISTVDSSPYLTHSIVLEYDFVRWVTRGLFVGKKRAYLAPQIDDLFLANDMWSTTLHANDPTTQFRITGTDLLSFVNWQLVRRQALALGSTFETNLAFNGVGTQTSEYPDTTLLMAAKIAGPTLSWLNHTWDHENLDALTRAVTKDEVAQNCTLAKSLKLHGFNCAELVTPDMSGLGSSDAILGMLDAGARFVVSDTSINETLRPGFPGTNPSFNVGRYNPINPGLYQVPRHPTSIFYDVSTPDTETDEYNKIYRAYYGRDLTYAEILDKDSEFGLYYLLQGDIDPLMFHQANLRKYSSSSAQSLYGDWIDAVLTKYLMYFDAPVITLGESNIGRAMQERGKLDACGLTATIVEQFGRRRLDLLTTSACTVPLTGVSSSISGLVENYGGEPTTSVTMSPGQVRSLALP
jgi:hypothetical protein